MTDTKQAQLNGAYYGPSIPPESNHRPRRGRGCVGGCCCCLLSLLWKIIVALLILVGLAILIVWLILQPNKFKVHVTDATLAEFNLTTTTTNPTLYYNMSLNMTFRNPNKKIGFYYDIIEVRAYYEDHRFSTFKLTNFYQGHKNTTTVNTSFKGQSLFLLDASDLKEFSSDKASGVYNIDMKLRLRIRPRIGDFISGHMNPKVGCGLKVPLKSSNGGNTFASFKTTKCDVNLW